MTGFEYWWQGHRFYKYEPEAGECTAHWVVVAPSAFEEHAVRSSSTCKSPEKKTSRLAPLRGSPSKHKTHRPHLPGFSCHGCKDASPVITSMSLHNHFTVTRCTRTSELILQSDLTLRSSSRLTSPTAVYRGCQPASPLTLPESTDLPSTVQSEPTAPFLYTYGTFPEPVFFPPLSLILPL